jgi:hypothetical protein
MLGMATAAGQSTGSVASGFMSRPSPLSLFRHTSLTPVRQFRYTEPVQMGRRAAKIAGRKVRVHMARADIVSHEAAARGAPLAASIARKHGLPAT